MVLISLFLILSSISYADTINNDIYSHWASKEIQTMIKDGIVQGYDNGLFLPDKEVSVSEFLKMLVLKNKYKLVINGSEWPDWYINTAMKEKLISENDFEDYSAIIKRIDCIKILSNYLDLSTVQKSKEKYSDLNSKNKDTILKIISLGIMNGFEDGTFRENEPITRGQACKILLNAYNAKIKLDLDKKYYLSRKNTNIDDVTSGDIIGNRYTISNNRILITDNGRFGSFNKLKLNQEFINDSEVIKLLKALVDDSSYTYLAFVPDKYTINKLNICYGAREDLVNNGTYAFQIRFYENGKYNVKESIGENSFMDEAKICISIYKMWDSISEYESIYSSSIKNMSKLEQALSTLFSEPTTSKIMNYIKEKIVESRLKQNDEFNAKILETISIGKLKINTICNKDQRIDFYFS